MSDEYSFDVFLSYSRKDKPDVFDIALRLQKDGLKVWFDDWIIKPGDNIPSKIEEGLESSRVLVLCMSANAFGSDWAKLESATFRFRDPLNKARKFIPLRLDVTPIKGTLAQFKYIKWLPSNRIREYQKLLEACRLAGTVTEKICTESNIKSKNLLTIPNINSVTSEKPFYLMAEKKGVKIKFAKVSSGEFRQGFSKEFLTLFQRKYNMRLLLGDFMEKTSFLPEFWMSVFPISNKQYYSYVKIMNKQVPYHLKPENTVHFIKQSQKPVTNITWKECIGFAHWLDARFPSLTEYEKACRGTDGTIYPWGNSFDSNMCNTQESGNNCLVDNGSYSLGNSIYGISDLIGNIWEWTADDDSAKWKLLYGSSFMENGDKMGSGIIKKSLNGDYCREDIGFRIACSHPEVLAVDNIERIEK